MKLRFYMDQESGIRAACLAAFEDEIVKSIKVGIRMRRQQDAERHALPAFAFAFACSSLARSLSMVSSSV